MNKISILIFVLLLTFQIVSAQIAIDSYSTNPDTVQPGDVISVDIQLENLGDNDIEDIIVSLDLTEIPFAPIDSSTEKIIDEIEEGEDEEVSFTIEALSNAQPQIYKIPVTLSYENTTKSSLISVEIDTDASINILLESSDLILVNEQGKVTIKIVNTGLTQIKLLQITLEDSTDYEILSSDSLYIGEIDVGDFETEEFTILAKDENPKLHFKLDYRDANNEEFSQERDLKLTVYSQEEAKELGLVKAGNSFTGILIIVVIIIGIAVWLRRRRRKKHVQ